MYKTYHNHLTMCRTELRKEISLHCNFPQRNVRNLVKNFSEVSDHYFK